MTLFLLLTPIRRCFYYLPIVDTVVNPATAVLSKISIAVGAGVLHIPRIKSVVKFHGFAVVAGMLYRYASLPLILKVYSQCKMYVYNDFRFFGYFCNMRNLGRCSLHVRCKYLNNCS